MSEITIRIRSTFSVGTASVSYSNPSSRGDIQLKLEPGSTIRDLLRKLPSLGPEQQFDDIMIHVFVNGVLRGHDYPLENGDVVDLHIPVSGG